MIDLAVMLALQDAGYGTYGETLWWNQSPVLSNGVVTSSYGIWVNSTTVSGGNGTYTDEITISTRYKDPIEQEKTLLSLMNWVRTVLQDMCELSTSPIIPNVTFPIVDISNETAIDLEAVDSEGRFVKTVRFQVLYKMPDTIPELG